MVSDLINIIKLHHALEMKTLEQIESGRILSTRLFEMSFATQEDVFKVIEEVVPAVFKEHTN